MHLLSSALSLAALAVSVNAQDGGTLTAALDYGTFEGAYSADYDISYWGKIPFAAPPVGENRFRAPQPPNAITNGTYNSTQTFDFCPQRETNGTEDCLYLGLYGRPWTQGEKLKPVVMTYYGGGFIRGSASFTVPPSAYPILNVSDQNDLIFVYPNYRVNAFGFLPGQEIADDPKSDFNNGLLDQQAALQWVHKYIDQFGGDPNNVTIWGQSAGAGSVVAQTIANGGRTHPRLFTKALASSPFWQKTYRYNSPEAQAIYDTFASRSNCSGPGSLACLKTQDLQLLREAALYISSINQYTTSSCTWAPVIDGTFLRETLTQATARGHVNQDAGWGMFNTHEGENFIPPGLETATGSGDPYFNSSVASFETWLHGYLPDLSARNFRYVTKHLYPASGETETLTYNDTYTRAGLIFRDTVLACPGLWMARASREKGYVGEYTIDPAQHGSDTIYWNRINDVQVEDPLIYEGYTGAFASFFETGDPNAHKLTDGSQPGVPEFHNARGRGKGRGKHGWGYGGHHGAIGEEFVITEEGFENVETRLLEERCDFWRSVGDEIDA